MCVVHVFEVVEKGNLFGSRIGWKRCLWMLKANTPNCVVAIHCVWYIDHGNGLVLWQFVLKLYATWVAENDAFCHPDIWLSHHNSSQCTVSSSAKTRYLESHKHICVRVLLAWHSDWQSWDHCFNRPILYHTSRQTSNTHYHFLSPIYSPFTYIILNTSR